jgi:mono/diheme cytochrome c family protein
MSIKKLIVVFPALIVLSCMAAAEDQPKTAVEHTTIKFTSPASGKEMYTAYCAVCHAADGKGGGPAAGALKTPPADLTLLSKTHGGKYPSMQVTSAIRGTNDVPSHGSREMPVWGPLFWGLSNEHEAEVQQRVANLSRYIEGLQAK